jgi:hypothetical protein
MSESLINEIRILIEKKMGKYKRELNADTKLEYDLGITGDDAVEFLIEYSNKFNVDVSDFNIAMYFMPEGDTVLPAIIRFFTRKKALKQKELTIGDLEKGIVAGNLNEEVINTNVHSIK